MRIYTINELIAAHWNGCTVQTGESPEQYAVRREEERYLLTCVLCCRKDTVFYVVLPDQTIEILGVDPTKEGL